MSPCCDDPVLDKEILFIKGSYPSTDSRLTWDYVQNPPLLSVGGKIAASGNIATSSEFDGAFFALQALGLGSFNFTPPSGYGGLVYAGGSIFYYWNTADNAWEQIDFSTHVSNTVSIIAGTGLTGGGPLTSNVTLSVVPASTVQLVNIAHNGATIATQPTINFVDGPGGSFSMSGNNISLVGGGVWNSNVNANNFGITNLASINGIPVSSFLTPTWNTSVNAAGNNLSNVGSLSVNTQIIYHGQLLEDIISGAVSGQWALNADGSIYRNSNVYIGLSTGTARLSVAGPSPNNVGIADFVSSNPNAFMYLETTGAPAFAAYAVKFNGAYGGEIGFATDVVEVWTTKSLIIRGYDVDGHAYIPGPLGVGGSSPLYKLDVFGDVNARGCYRINGGTFACPDGSGGVTISNVSAINGSPISGSGAFSQTPWTSNINGGGFSLTNVASVGVNTSVTAASLVINGPGGINSVGNIVTSGCFYIGSNAFACAATGGGINLSNVATINGVAPPTGGSGAGFVTVISLASQTTLLGNNTYNALPGMTFTINRAGKYLITANFYTLFQYSAACNGTLAVNGVASALPPGETTNPYSDREMYGQFTRNWVYQLNVGDVLALWASTTSQTAGVFVLAPTELVVQWIAVN